MDRRGFVRRLFAAACATRLLEASTRRDDCKRLHIEVIASTLEDALAAQRGGATQLEVAVHLQQGGFTPPLEVVWQISRRTNIPQRVMLRENAGFVISGSQELETLMQKARALTALNIQGLVVGWVKNGQLDLTALRQIMMVVPHTKITVHNAIEQTNDPLQALKALKQFPNVDRVLVTGIEPKLPDRIARLRAYEEVVGASPCIVVGRLRFDEAVQIEAATRIREFHFGDAVRTPERPAPDGAVDTEKVRQAAAMLSARMQFEE